MCRAAVAFSGAAGEGLLGAVGGCSGGLSSLTTVWVMVGTGVATGVSPCNGFLLTACGYSF